MACVSKIKNGVMTRPRPTLLAILALLAAPLGAPAQTEIACGTAVAQLQAYVQQVNAAGQFEYSRGIPVRCGYNTYCAQVLLQQLSAWYAHQSMLVNQWYSTIAHQCSSMPPQPGRSARKRQTNPSDELEGVDDLKVDSEDTTVRIKIPSKPSGYRR